MTNIYDLIESILCELEGLGGAVHFHEAGIYESTAQAVHGCVADHPGMAPAVAMALGEALGCLRHNNIEGAVFELERLMDSMDE